MRCPGTQVILLVGLTVVAGAAANLARSGDPEKYLPWTTDIYTVPAEKPSKPDSATTGTPSTGTSATGTSATGSSANDPSPPDGNADRVAVTTPPATPTDDGEFSRLGFEAALEEYDAGTTFVDARRTKEYVAGHINGAISISPYEQATLADKIMRLTEEVPEEAPVVVYCTASADCEDSALVSRQLQQAGFQNIMIYEGGFPEWDAKLKTSARRSSLVTKGNVPGERE